MEAQTVPIRDLYCFFCTTATGNILERLFIYRSARANLSGNPCRAKVLALCVECGGNKGGPIARAGLEEMMGQALEEVLGEEGGMVEFAPPSEAMVREIEAEMGNPGSPRFEEAEEDFPGSVPAGAAQEERTNLR